MARMQVRTRGKTWKRVRERLRLGCIVLHVPVGIEKGLTTDLGPVRWIASVAANFSRSTNQLACQRRQIDSVRIEEREFSRSIINRRSSIYYGCRSEALVDSQRGKIIARWW